jgi:hypothetical protein
VDVALFPEISLSATERLPETALRAAPDPVFPTIRTRLKERLPVTWFTAVPTVFTLAPVSVTSLIEKEALPVIEISEWPALPVITVDLAPAPTSETARVRISEAANEYVPAGIAIVSEARVALASSTAARRVQAPPTAAHTPFPGAASAKSAVLLTTNARAEAGLAGATTRPKHVTTPMMNALNFIALLSLPKGYARGET